MPRVSGVELQRPVFESLPQWHDTFGPEVAELCEIAGYPPDVEQAWLLDHVFGFDKAGRPTAFEVAVIAPRQNLKTAFLKMVSLGKLFVLGRTLVVWSAHEFATAAEAFRDLAALIEGCPDLDREVRHVHRGSGAESIELTGDRRLRFRARTKAGGRGLTGDDMVLDEAFALREDHMGALLPTLTAVQAPQIFYGSSAGQADSQVLRDLRDRGRAGGDPRLLYVEWSDPEPNGCGVEDCDHAVGSAGCALDDEARWLRVNTAVARGRIELDTLRAFRRSMPAREFAREFLGWWDEVAGTVSDLPVGVWLDSQTEDSPAGELSLALDVAPGHTWASVVVCGGGVLELVDRRRGSAWAPARLAELCRRHGIADVVIDPAGPVGSLIPDLDAAGVTLRMLTGRQSVQACGALVEAVNTKRIRHRPADAFVAAVAGAARRAVGDGYKWSRVGSEVDITPLVASTWAAWDWLDGQSLAYDVAASVF